MRFSEADGIRVEPGQGFSAALSMLANLPLSPAEKAEAVRRLLAECGSR